MGIDLSLGLEVDSEGLDAVSDVEAIDSETEIVDLDELSTELELDEDFALDNLDLSVEDGLSEIEEELEGTDLTLDVLDNELVVDEDELVVDDIDALGTELDEDVIDAELSLDDLDLELDKIDSDLDINFDLGADEVDEEVEEVEEVEIDDSLLDSGLVVDELEEIADVLVNEEDDLPVVDEPDDTLLEESELAVVAEEDGFDSELADDEDFDFLAGTDEAATKLDLARAYIDMGDGDGAKDILEEVALEGNNEQKQEAQDLLKTLD